MINPDLMSLMTSEIEDLRAFKMLATEMANRKGFDSVNNAINSIKPCECGCIIENEVLRKLLSARWASKDRPMCMVIDELIEMKIKG